MLKGIKWDKWRHFLVGAVMGVVFEILILWIVPAYIIIGSVIAFIIIALLSYGFELTSLITKKGHYDILDAIAGAVGGLVGMIIILLVN